MRTFVSLVVSGVLIGSAWGQGLGRPNQPVAHRIMAIGDSITMGAGTSGGYRSILEKQLKAAGFRFIFVGHSMENSAGMSFRRHEGHSSWSTNDLIYGRPDQPQLGKLWNWLNYAKPDTLLIMIGTNDPIYLPKQDWAAKYNRLLAQVFSYNPAVRVVMAPIPKSNNAMTGKQTAESICYDIVKTAVAQWKARGYTIVFADSYTSFNTSSDLSDAYHPNATGYRKIANAFYNALIRL